MNVNKIAIGIIFMLIAYLPANLTYKTNFSNGRILYVGGDGEGNYTNIQDAINDANDGDTIFVYDDSFPYCENLVINKSIQLIGENKNVTIIGKDSEENVLSIFANNVVIRNFTIKGSYMPKAGIYISGSIGNKISNCVLRDNGIGILIEEATKINIVKCDIFDNLEGIYIEVSSENKICSCIVHDNYEGISIYGNSEYVFNNSIENCSIYSNDDYGIEIYMACKIKLTNSSIFYNRYGLRMYCSFNNSIFNCKFINNGIHIGGDNIHHYIHKIENVTINGKPFLYFVNEKGKMIEGEIGGILMVNCSNFYIKNLKIEKTDVGIEISYGRENIIENCKIYGCNDCGILIINSSHNEIIDCEIKSEDGQGLKMLYSSKNNISNNKFIKNNVCVIELVYSDENLITNNTLNGKYNPQFGICIESSKRNFIAYNNITGFWDIGIVIASYLSIDKNIIYKNTFYRNGISGIWIADSIFNIIEKNNFIDQPVHASFENAWNVWLRNYWDGWRTPLPKPIYGYIESFSGIRLFPLINFDWLPSPKPWR